MASPLCALWLVDTRAASFFEQLQNSLIIYNPITLSDNKNQSRAYTELLTDKNMITVM